MQVDLLERASVAGAPLRKAAMLLHSMAEADRRWMLARLDPGQRPRIEALLEELRALEFPVDAELVRQSLAGGATIRTASAAQAAGVPGWTVEQAAQVLLTEPDDVVALMLRAGDWPWAADLRAQLGAERARRVDASRYSVAGEVPQTLLDAVTEAARARLAALQDELPPRRAGRSPIVARSTP